MTRLHFFRRRPKLLILVAVSLLTLLPATPAHAVEERAVTAFDVDIVVDDEGTVHVTERLTYAFGDDDAPVVRVLPHQGSIDGSGEHDFNLTNVEVTDSAGEQYEVETLDDETEIHIGDDGMTGTPTFEIAYQYQSLLVATDNDDARLFLDIVGTGWEIPVEDIDVTVKLPEPSHEANCYAGAEGSTNPCDSATLEEEAVAATHSSVEPGEAMSVDVTFPAGAWDLSQSTPPTAVTAVGIIFVVFSGLTCLAFLFAASQRRLLGNYPGATSGFGGGGFGGGGFGGGGGAGGGGGGGGGR